MEASRLKHTLAALPRPPVSDMTIGVKDPCSTSRTLSSYVRRLILSCFLYMAEKQFFVERLSSVSLQAQCYIALHCCADVSFITTMHSHCKM